MMMMMMMMTMTTQWLAGANFDTDNPRIPLSEEELKMSFKIVRSV